MLSVLNVARVLMTFTVSDNLDELATDVKDTKEKIQEIRLNEREKDIQDWLSAPDPSRNYINALEKRHQGTGAWFIDSYAFADWNERSNSFLWLHGIPGCGKTVLSSTIIEHLKSGTTPFNVLLYFYFDFSDTNKQTLENVLRSLVNQLYERHLNSREPLDQLWYSRKEKDNLLSKKSLGDVLLAMLSKFHNVSIVLDALDESTTRSDVVAWLRCVLTADSFKCRIIVTARREKDIESALLCWMSPENMISIQQGDVNDDIRAYVVHAVHNGEALKRWHSMPGVQVEIETELVKRADGM
jgi:hypothetical protein